MYQGAKNLTLGQIDPKDAGKRSNEIVAERNKMTVKQVQRYIKLNDLVPDLQKMMDEGQVKFTPAVELSYIKPKNQQYIAVAEYYPPWEPPVSRFRATRKWYFPPSEPPQHIVAAHIFDFTINLLIVILGELLMQYHQIIYREVFLCLRRQKSEVFWNFWEKI